MKTGPSNRSICIAALALCASTGAIGAGFYEISIYNTETPAPWALWALIGGMVAFVAALLWLVSHFSEILENFWSWRHPNQRHGKI